MVEILSVNFKFLNRFLWAMHWYENHSRSTFPVLSTQNLLLKIVALLPKSIFSLYFVATYSFFFRLKHLNPALNDEILK